MPITPIEKQRGFAIVGLFNPKSSVNVGSVMRASHCFDVKMVVIEGKRYKKAPTDTTYASRHVPLLNGQPLHESIPHDCIPVAVELLPQARSIVQYKHPERAFYVFGPEDGTLGKRVTDWCKDVIYIPSQYCLNLGNCVNIVLYDRMLKQCQNQCINKTPKKHQNCQDLEPSILESMTN